MYIFHLLFCVAFPVEEVVAGVACLLIIVIIISFVFCVVLLWMCMKRKSRISGTQEGLFVNLQSCPCNKMICNIIYDIRHKKRYDNHKPTVKS